MILHHLSITNYRNLRSVDLSLSPHVNCFVGANGMGKSNILDAIYYLSFCRGYANSLDGFNVNHESDYFILEGSFEGELGVKERINCALKLGSRKRLKIDGKDVKRISEHIGRIPLVMIAPADSALITGGSEERRRFMDTVIMQYSPAYLEALIRYDQSLKQRNAMLKQEAEPDYSVMEVIEQMMAQSGAVVYEARKQFVADFEPIFSEIYCSLSGAPSERVGLVYESHGSRGDLVNQLREFRAKERIVGFSLHGMHKDELQLQLSGHPVKREASQGQQKTFYIAMKLAQFVYLGRMKGRRRTPLLLLDDIFDKLDAGRVARIIDYVAGHRFGQIFITDTSQDNLDRILEATTNDYRLFRVVDGEAREVSRKSE